MPPLAPKHRRPFDPSPEEAERRRKQAVEARRPDAATRGYDAAWRAARAEFLAAPENERCFSCGARASLVHHEKAHKGDRNLFWDRRFWRPACRPCNSRICAAQEGGYGNKVIG